MVQNEENDSKPDKCQAIVLNKKGSDLTNTYFQVEISLICRASWYSNRWQAYFNLHISKICKSAASQLNALMRLKLFLFLSFHAKEVLINSYVISNFNYCPLAWMLSSTQSLNKIENFWKGTLQFFYDGFEASYEDLPSKGRKSKMNVRRLRTLCVEIYKT